MQLLLGHEHAHAAAKAVNAMHLLLASLQQQLLQEVAGGRNSSAGGADTNGVDVAGSTTTAAQQLLSSAAVKKLWCWHSCLESVDPTALPTPCWFDVFAHILLTGALKAFAYGYQQVCFLSLHRGVGG